MQLIFENYPEFLQFIEDHGYVKAQAQATEQKPAPKKKAAKTKVEPKVETKIEVDVDVPEVEVLTFDTVQAMIHEKFPKGASITALKELVDKFGRPSTLSPEELPAFYEALKEV